MNKPLLKFFFPLERYELGQGARRGPLFHRWLPDGQKDAIVLDRPDDHYRLKLWFERRGFKNDLGWISHSYDRFEIPLDEIPKQKLVDAGGIFGQVRLDEVSDATIMAIRNDVQDDPDYEALAKRVVKHIVGPAIVRLMNILRVNYGQYWLDECEPWDSRVASIGARCDRFQLKWTPNGTRWLDFRPNKTVQRASVIFDPSDKRYEPLLNETDWKDIRSLMDRGYDPPPEGEIICRALESLDQGRERFALLDAITAIELAVERRLEGQLAGEKLLLDAVQSFRGLPLRAQVVAVAGLSGGTDPGDVKLAIEAIDWRNRAVHEGANLPPSVDSKILGLLRVACALLPLVPTKFLEIDPRKSLPAPDAPSRRSAP